MNRRELIQLGGAAVVLAPFLNLGCAATVDNTNCLLFDPGAVGSIRLNAQSEMLADTFAKWSSEDRASVQRRIELVTEKGDLLSDMSTSMTAIFEQCVVHLVSESEQSAELVSLGLDVLGSLPVWDYMRDGETDVIGLMRASKASVCSLFALQVLGDRVTAQRKESILRDVAEKGCVPCNRTLSQMDDNSLAKGWGVDSAYRDRVSVDMTRWPAILGRNNLRAIPTMGLGLGALALEGNDRRANEWLRRAVDSSKTYLGLHEEDGSYFEGISYVDFAFRSLFPFLDAYDRIKGDVDWAQHVNMHGVCEYIAALQNGLKEDGTPDIINISDARDSVFVCVPAWIAKRTGDPLAQHVADNYSKPGFYADFLWYNPDLASTAPEARLRNARLDLDWVVCRSGWAPDDTVVGFRSGDPSNHEHADRNSISIKSRGERLLTDPLGASYNANDPHWVLRLTKGHNAVLVNGHGHQYHNGEEGTNEGLARAKIVEFVDNDDVVHWTSDATHGYNLIQDEISLVMRSVLFVKPDLIVIVDRVDGDPDVTASVRFHPDNRDNLAIIKHLSRTAFSIQRPKATLLCGYESDVGIRAKTASLDIPVQRGMFPFVELICDDASSATIVTAARISSDQFMNAPVVSRGAADAWEVRSGEITVGIKTANQIPEFVVSRP